MERMYPPQVPGRLEPHYSRHVEAMTREGLHLKSAIAEQLAWRDLRIEQLEQELEQERNTNAILRRMANT